jgi:hypothetical protein
VLTTEAQLFLGDIGEALEDVNPGEEVFSTVGWSPDGAMAAVGCKDCVRVWHANSCQSFTVKVASQVLPQIANPIASNPRVGALRGAYRPSTDSLNFGRRAEALCGLDAFVWQCFRTRFSFARAGLSSSAECMGDYIGRMVAGRLTSVVRDRMKRRRVLLWSWTPFSGQTTPPSWSGATC